MDDKQSSRSTWNDWLYPIGMLGLVTFNVVWEIRWRKVMREMVEREDLASSWAQRALHDPLTNLPNRTLLRDRIEQALYRSRRNRNRVGILFIDLDDFKRVNDEHGHHAGDRLLIAISERFLQCIRPSDTVARLGGDEFVIVVEADDALAAVESVAEKIRRALHIPLLIDPEAVTLNASIGVVLSMSAGEQPEDLLEAADAALLAAKQSGKNQVVIREGSGDQSIAVDS